MIGPPNCTIEIEFETGVDTVDAYGNIVRATTSATYRGLFLAGWGEKQNVTEIDHSLVGQELLTVFLFGEKLPYPLKPELYCTVTKDAMVSNPVGAKRYRIFAIPLEDVKYISTWELHIVEAPV